MRELHGMQQIEEEYRCIGTFRSEAAKQGHIEIHEAIGRLKRTTFRAHPALFERAITGSL